VPTAPAGLVNAGSSLCPNDFPASSYIDDGAWDLATDQIPWYTSCNFIFLDNFE